MRLLSQVNLNSLKIVESAARHKNFTRAGEEQFITASAVSQRVKSLEDQLRFKIFQRGGNAVSLTPEGHGLIHGIIEGHFANERRVLEALDAPDSLADELRRLLVALGDTSLD